ncbi:unnamed protein product [Symbiodinium sp. CCMP2592]|nr:unnamed protein product [Symbiodinium sp. CCMP2592]
MTCYHSFLTDDILFQKLHSYVNSWLEMDKLEQDQFVFSRVRELALEQKIIQADSGKRIEKADDNEQAAQGLQYHILDVRICRKAFASLHLMGEHPRLRGLVSAVMQGRSQAPTDKRYLKRNQSQTSVKTGEVYSYLETLYESVAERLPEDDAVELDMSGDLGNQQDDSEAEESNVILLADCEASVTVGHDSKKYLPPGSIYDEYKQYLALGNEKCSFSTFIQVWQTHFAGILGFRGKRQHAMCATCTRHKLLLSCMPHAAARTRQRLLFERHLADQYRDRMIYWKTRGDSRALGSSTLSIIMDSVDQAKFAWPRSKVFRSKQFDAFHRPRLHITAAIAHGHAVMVYVAHSDVTQAGATTVDMLGHLLTRLKDSVPWLRP